MFSVASFELQCCLCSAASAAQLEAGLPCVLYRVVLCCVVLCCVPGVPRLFVYTHAGEVSDARAGRECGSLRDEAQFFFFLQTPWLGVGGEGGGGV